MLHFGINLHFVPKSNNSTLVKLFKNRKTFSGFDKFWLSERYPFVMKHMHSTQNFRLFVLNNSTQRLHNDNFQSIKKLQNKKNAERLCLEHVVWLSLKTGGTPYSRYSKSISFESTGWTFPIKFSMTNTEKRDHSKFFFGFCFSYQNLFGKNAKNCPAYVYSR